jgi:hypothetical protein
MKFARKDQAGSANGIAALAIVKMLLDAMLKKEVLSAEEVDIIMNCAEIEVTNANARGDLSEAKSLIENLFKDPDDEDEKTNL